MKIVVEPWASFPLRGFSDDAGLDLRTPEEFVIKSGGSYVVDTGVHVEIPRGYYGKLESKSGLHIKHDIVCLGGVVDCGYTGSIRVKLYNFGKDYTFHTGDKIVQLIIVPCVIPTLEVVDALEETDRGEGGFGSTGR